MGVLNVTPDSFSDGGKFFDRSAAVEHALRMADAGADIIDVGGESTRPGAKDISIDAELDRVIPVIEKISAKIDLPISIDTRKSKVAEAAIKSGACIINDISGLAFDSEMASVAARYETAMILMHMKGTPQNMQLDPVYKDLIEEIIETLRDSIGFAKKGGVSEDKIIIDPGIGFGKTVKHNLQILNRLQEFKILGRPVCVGVSRKSYIGKVLGLDNADDRLSGTLASSAVAITKGANILRLHDVEEAVQVARMADSILKEEMI